MIKQLFYRYWKAKVDQPGYLATVDKPNEAQAMISVHRIDCRSQFNKPISNGSVAELEQIDKIEYGTYTYQKHVALAKNACIVGPNAIVLTRKGNVVIESALGHVWCLNKSSPFLIIFHKWQRTHQRLESAVSLTHIYCSNSTLNYYHWIMDSLLPLMYFMEYAAQKGFSYRIIIPAKSQAFMIESLRLLNPSASIYYWPELPSCKVAVDNLYLTSTPTIAPHRYALYDQHAIACLRKRMFSNLPETGSANKMPKRFFITRQATGSRRVRNFNQLSAVLSKYNIAIVDLAQMPFGEQVALFRNATLVVSTHGVGLTNILFCNKDAQIVECVARMDVPRDYTHYYRLAMGVGLRHYFYQDEYVRLGESTKDVHYDLDINTAAFDRFISDVLPS